jgi:hypothetical protein
MQACQDGCSYRESRDFVSNLVTGIATQRANTSLGRDAGWTLCKTLAEAYSQALDRIQSLEEEMRPLEQKLDRLVNNYERTCPVCFKVLANETGRGTHMRKVHGRDY